VRHKVARHPLAAMHRFGSYLSISGRSLSALKASKVTRFGIVRASGALSPKQILTYH
jgi:hypothetical protein